MEITELMVGDWVYQDVPEQPYFQIEDYYDISDADDFEPIPITPEILKRNGFVCLELEGKLTFVDNAHLALVSDKEFSGPYNIFHTQIMIEYVHELQHALRLCKIDKEIKLL